MACKYTSVQKSAAAYEDFDDSLTAAAEDVAKERDLVGWDLPARWQDESRDIILVFVPVREG